MLLKNVHWYSEARQGFTDIRITDGHIEEMARGLSPRFREDLLNLRDGLALPGLINSHDHLEFNLLPIGGNPSYVDLTAYAKEVYRPDQSPIREMLSITIPDRMFWGGYKNLISGVTSVCHHNPYHSVFETLFPVRVIKNVGWTHSLRYSKDPVGDFRKAAGRPFVIHAAEGVDDRSRLEVSDLDRLGLLRNNTIIVHGVALGEEEIGRLERAGAALIWCPSSNLRLFRRTAPVDRMRSRVPIALGTDSLLTAEPTLFDELRVARATDLATPEELFQMVTTQAARILRLRNGAGTIRVGAAADLTVLSNNEREPLENLMLSRPRDVKLVLVSGQVRLADADLNLCKPNAWVDGRRKFLTGDLAGLRRRIVEKVGEQAEEIVTSQLWQMVQVD